MQIQSRWLKSLTLAGGFVAFAMGAKVSHAVLNFDDLPQPAVGALVEIPNPYHGFTATEAGQPTGSTSPSPLALEGNNDYAQSYGNAYGAPSAPNAVFNDLGDGVTLSAASPFIFSGAEVSTFANGNFSGNLSGQVYATTSAITLTITGSLVGVPVPALNPTTALSDTGYAFFNPQFAGPVDSVTFTGNGSADTSPLPDDFFLLDNVGVPEPSSLAVLGVGALTLLSRRRRSENL